MCRRRLAVFVLATGATVGGWLGVNQATADEGSSFLLPAVSAESDLDSSTDHYLVPARRKFVRLSQRLKSLPEDEDDDEQPRLRRFGSDRETDDRDDAQSDSDRDDFDSDDEDGDEDDGISSSLINQRIDQNSDGRFVLPMIATPTTSTITVGNGKLPEGFRGVKPSPTISLPESGQERQLDSKPWAWSTTRWAAANTYSHPRYFEDRMLERHGHERFPALQPFASGARFFATVPMLPYLMTLSHPCNCESTLGYYRSGSCAPTLHQQPPYSSKAAFVQAVSMGSVIAIFP